MKHLYFFALVAFLAAYRPLQAQVDTEFWFATPNTVTHNVGQPIDRLFRISTFGQAATVTISQPANAGFVPIVFNMGANTSTVFNISPWAATSLATPADVVLNGGFQITSTASISVYYEVTSLTDIYQNPDIFVLKGKNALGTEFYTPFQNFWNNLAYSSQIPNNAFDIVATEDNTAITITPSQAIVGHAANVPFTITLNKGQMYSAEAVSGAASQHLSGSHIVADKPIAITLKDDSVNNQSVGGCGDLNGDQLVPVDQLGKEYILVKGFLNNNNDRAFVLAVEDGTQVSINGTVTAMLNTGDTYPIVINQPSMLVTMNKPSYVWHVTGFGCEVGGAVLPAINCRGSRQINFTRSNDESFGIILITKAEWYDDFLLNGQAIASSNFAPVPGTNNEWYAASIQYTTAQLASGVASSVVNTQGLFQMGIINGGAASGCRYGYFSEYNLSEVNLGADLSLCEGQTRVLNATATGATYLWQDGSTQPIFTVNGPGQYSVTVDILGCQSSDTIQVDYFPYPVVELGPNRTLCTGASLTLDAGNPGATYQWHNSSTSQTFTVTQAGVYAVTVSSNGCTASDNITISTLAPPTPFVLGRDTTICLGDTLVLDATQAGIEAYVWLDGFTEPIYEVTESGIYLVSWINGCGSANSEPVNIEVRACNCRLEIPSVFTPNGDGKNDVFGAFYTECSFDAFQLQVYNRWGAEVFSTTDPAARWNGEVKGQAAPSDVFVYRLAYTVDGQETVRQGDLTLVR